MFVLVDHRIPVVKSRRVSAVLKLAFAHAKKDRDKYYAVLFQGRNDSPAKDEPPHESRVFPEKEKVPASSACQSEDDDSDTAEEEDFFGTPGYRYNKLATFPSHDAFKSYAWGNVMLFRSRNEDMLYLNPKILDEYEKMRRWSDKTRICVLIHCVATHEIAHLLHFRAFKAQDPYFTEQNSGIDYGTEIEYRLYGGRILSTPDFTRFRIERRDGTRFELDPIYFLEEVLSLSQRRINFDALNKIGVEEEGDCQTWLGMGEINGTHERKDCEQQIPPNFEFFDFVSFGIVRVLIDFIHFHNPRLE